MTLRSSEESETSRSARMRRDQVCADARRASSIGFERVFRTRVPVHRGRMRTRGAFGQVDLVRSDPHRLPAIEIDSRLVGEEVDHPELHVRGMRFRLM